MHDIPMSEVTPEFARCWQAAGMHIERAAGGQLNAWLRAHLNPPFLEHLSFRLGNQLFFLRVEDEEGRIEGPGSLQGLLSVADGCSGHGLRSGRPSRPLPQPRHGTAHHGHASYSVPGHGHPGALGHHHHVRGVLVDLVGRVGLLQGLGPDHGDRRVHGL